MERKVEILKAANIAWITVVLLLLIGMFYEVIMEDKLSILSVILSLSLAVYFGSLIYFRKTRNHENK